MKIQHIIPSLLLVGCFAVTAQTTNTPATTATSGTTGISGSQIFSADTNAQLEKIRRDYGVGLVVGDHHILVVTPGFYMKERMDQIEVALHEVFSNDFTNYTIGILCR